MASIITTKLVPPSTRLGLVPRPGLLERLDEGLNSGCKLVLLAAPAGFGKTTLVLEWLQTISQATPPLAIAWLSLDGGDNDPARFFTYLLASLRVVDPHIGESAQVMMSSPQPPAPEVWLTSLVNDLAACPHPFALILDDYHFIQALPIHQQLGFLVAHQPTNMRLVILSREDPPLPLSQLRARGQMVEIRQDDLRFSSIECAQFLHQGMGLDLSSAEIASLERRTEGWIAGLQLAALSMKGSPDRQAFLRAFTGSNRYILDYLGEEVFSQQPADVQDFLLMTAILDRFSASLCEAVTQRPDCLAILRRLEDANLFIVPLDPAREWYRYHRLFVDLLRHRLHTKEQHLESTLHLQASRWFESHDFPAEAVQHALAAEDWEVAGSVIFRASGEAIRTGQLATLTGWLNALPEETVRGSFELATSKGWVSLMMGQFEAALSYAALAESLVTDHVTLESQASLTALRASLALAQQDIPTAIGLSQETLASIQRQDEPFLRGLVLNNLAQAHLLSGDLPAAIETYHQIVHLAQGGSHSPTTISAMANLAALLHQGGKRREALVCCQDALDQCLDSRGRPLPLAGYVHIPMGILCYEANDLERAQYHLQQGMELGQQLGVMTGVTTGGGMVLARLQQAQGDAAAALKTIAEIRQLAARFELVFVNILAAGVEADILLKQGNIEAAARWAESSGLSPSDMPNPLQEENYLTLARLLLAQDRFEEADTFLNNFQGFAEQGGRQRILITVCLFRARAYQALGRGKLALDHLAKALHLAAPEGYIRAFLDEGQALIDLLPRVRHVAPAFVSQLLEAVQGEPGLQSPPTGIQPLVEPLSERELDLLQLVAEGYSNREIAERLVISVGTVKAHLHNIYGKLDVSGRTQALARARELGIF